MHLNGTFQQENANNRTYVDLLNLSFTCRIENTVSETKNTGNKSQDPSGSSSYSIKSHLRPFGPKQFL